MSARGPIHPPADLQQAAPDVSVEKSHAGWVFARANETLPPWLGTLRRRCPCLFGVIRPECDPHMPVGLGAKRPSNPASKLLKAVTATSAALPSITSTTPPSSAINSA